MDDVSDCLTALSSDELAERAAAAERLCQLGDEAQDAIVPLVRACADDESVSTWAVAALEQLGPPPIAMRDQLTQLTEDSEENVAYWATTLLGRLGSDGAPCLTPLVSCLNTSPHAAVRQRAAWALGRIGQSASVATNSLEAAATSADDRLARLAKEALRNIRAG